MNLEHVVEAVALGLAGWAALKSVPRQPDRDLQRLFKIVLSTVIRGQVEESKGGAEEWESRVLGAVLYNPAAREPEALLVAPDPDVIPTPALEGERALVERLAALADPAERVRLLFHEDHRVLDSLFGDPAALGAAYDPSAVLAPDVDWDGVAAWSGALNAALGRRLDAVIFVVVGDASLAAALDEAAPALPVVMLPTDVDDASAFLDLMPRPEQRMVVVARGDAAPRLVRLLHADDALRDRLMAFVSVGGDVSAEGAQAEWMTAHFTHDEFEPEVLRAVPYLSLIEVEGEDLLLRDWAPQRFPSRPPAESGRSNLDTVDLGAVDRALLPDAVLARGLLITVAFRLSG